MNYLVLARKYRPQTFSELVGQEHIVTTLKNALKSGKVWQALIFSGSRGTGKTSTARIFAKAVNCLSETFNFEPCNSCKNCIEITQGNCVDVIEIDAASNRGIDEIRSLRESVKYVPVSCKYKVYIIDEAHQITDAAFNAFLKTLEEPPNYVIFILATTEFNALPQTIISRCQVFHFRPVRQNIIFERLKLIVEKEKKLDKIENDVLEFIAENAGGSVRDALSLLDQILSLISVYKKIDLKLIREIWGFTPNEVLEKYIELIISSNINSVLNFIDEIYNNMGIDFIQFSKDLLDFFNKLLYLKNGLKVISNYNLEKFKEKFSNTHILSYIQQLLNLNEDIKKSDFPKIMFELYSIKFTKQYLEIDEIIKNLDFQKQNDHQNIAQDNNLIKNGLEKQKNNNISDYNNKINYKDVESAWEKLLEKIKIEKPLSYAILIESKVCFYNDTIKILFPNRYVKLQIEQHNLNLENLLKNLLNKDIKVIYDVEEKKDNIVIGESQNKQNKEDTQPILIKPKKPNVSVEVEKICKIFSGKIVPPKHND